MWDKYKGLCQVLWEGKWRRRDPSGVRRVRSKRRSFNLLLGHDVPIGQILKEKHQDVLCCIQWRFIKTRVQSFTLDENAEQQLKVITVGSATP